MDGCMDGYIPFPKLNRVIVVVVVIVNILLLYRKVSKIITGSS